MSLARLTITPPPVSPAAQPSSEEAERLASILRKYATGSVAIEAGNTLRVDLRRIPWACAEPERARRLGVLASTWTGRKVETRIEEAPSQPATGPFTASLRRRPAEAATAFRGRIRRAAERLALLVETHGEPCRRWMVRLERDGASAVMPLPGALLEQGQGEFDRRLPVAALENVTAVRLEARTGTPASVQHPRTRTTADGGLGRGKPLAKVS